MRVVVTGATGRVGSRTVQRLVDDGHEVVAVVRRENAQLASGATRFVADLEVPGSLAELPEADAAVLIFPSVQADANAADVVATLADRVGAIVYVSALNAPAFEGAPGIMGSHALLEGLIRRSGTDWTFLRCSGFAANALHWADAIKDTGVVRFPGALARRSLVHEDDLAAVAAAAVADRARYRGEALELTGPEQLTQREYARRIGEVIGSPVEFVDLDAEQAMAELFSGMPPEFGRSIVAGQQAMVQHPEPCTRTVEQVLGRPARSFTDWVGDHRAAFVS